MFLQTVIGIIFIFKFIISNLLKTATDCCPTERQMQRDARGSVVCVHSTCRSTMNNTWLRTVCKWFGRNNAHLTLKCEPLQISCLRSDSRRFWGDSFDTFCYLKVAMEKTRENFPHTKSVASFRKRLRECVKTSGRPFEHFCN